MYVSISVSVDEYIAATAKPGASRRRPSGRKDGTGKGAITLRSLKIPTAGTNQPLSTKVRVHATTRRRGST